MPNILSISFRKHEQKEVKPRHSNQIEQIRVRRRYGYVAAEKRLHEKYKTICFINTNECIGEV